MKDKILFIFGTRPEAIKMAPLILELKKPEYHHNVIVCSTGQHAEMLDQVVDFFNLHIDFKLNVMEQNQSLSTLTSNVILKLHSVLLETDPDFIVVQGDTTTAFIGALSAYYNQKQVIHIEAGLRTNNKYSPFPEEMNRSLISKIADYHFAPTLSNQKSLQEEGIKSNTFVVGNTVIDAIQLAAKILKKTNIDFKTKYPYLINKRSILVTAHRRESFGNQFHEICQAIKKIAVNNDLEIIYPVHLNPNVRKPVFEILGEVPNIHLVDPVPYHEMVWLLNESHIVLTDSGGIQEEAPGLGKPVLVMRNNTERMEGIEAGTAILVGTDKKRIIDETETLLNNPRYYKQMSKAVNPYGDGTTSKQIAKILGELQWNHIKYVS